MARRHLAPRRRRARDRARGRRADARGSRGLGGGARGASAPPRAIPISHARNMTRTAVPGLDAHRAQRAVRARPQQARVAVRVRRRAAPGRAPRRAARRQPRDELARRGGRSSPATAAGARTRSRMPGCLFSTAIAELPEGRREPCQALVCVGARLVRRPPRGQHRVRLAQRGRPDHAGPRQALLRRHARRLDARAWTALPRSVKKIVVLRDAPTPPTTRCAACGACSRRHAATRPGLRDAPRRRRPVGLGRRRPRSTSARSATASSTSRASSAAAAAATPSSAACASSTTCSAISRPPSRGRSGRTCCARSAA